MLLRSVPNIPQAEKVFMQLVCLREIRAPEGRAERFVRVQQSLEDLRQWSSFLKRTFPRSDVLLRGAVRIFSVRSSVWGILFSSGQMAARENYPAIFRPAATCS